MEQIVLDIFTPILLLFLAVLILNGLMATLALVGDFIRQVMP